MRSLHWASYFVEEYGQDELNLAGIGESTMHPNFVEFLGLARMAVGPDVRIVLATNGVLMTNELAQAMKPWNPDVYVSLHQPVLAKRGVDAIAEAGLLRGISVDPAIAAINWAGQVKWKATAPKGRECDWVTGGKTMVMSDGRITRCCLDASGVGVLGSIFDDLTQIRTTPYSLCRTCDMNVGMPIPEEAEAVA